MHQALFSWLVDLGLLAVVLALERLVRLALLAAAARAPTPTRGRVRTRSDGLLLLDEAVEIVDDPGCAIGSRGAADEGLERGLGGRLGRRFWDDLEVLDLGGAKCE